MNHNTIARQLVLGEKLQTLRSTLERRYKTLLNSGSLRIVRHFPAPCLTTPAFRADSSSDVHFCLGAPIRPPKKMIYLNITRTESDCRLTDAITKLGGFTRFAFGRNRS
ncbi:hypothetical protein HanPSC8_Chr10g0430451 [Helianthus annuus]|nr:hypothetical protein HanPSC8_Chr10g0430451 [Helianthus annuus]